MSEFSPRVAQPEGGLSRVNAGSKKFELKDGFQFPQRGVRGTLDAKSRLPHTPECVAIRPVLAGGGRQLRRPLGVKPVGIYGPKVISAIQHRITVKIEGVGLLDLFGLLFGLPSFRC